MNPIGTVILSECLFEVDDFILTDGRTLLISEYPELFAAIGIRFGGDGIINFKIPFLDEVSDILRFVIRVK
jgi:microcystin-dependent protein